MIEIDSREKKYLKLCEYLAEYLPEGVYFNVPEGGLDHGADYVIRNESELAIQRKEVNDFVSTMNDPDRDLKETMHQLRSNYEHSMLLLEGNWKTAGDKVAMKRGRVVQTSLSFKSMQNFILSQQMRGSFYYRTVSLRETARSLASFHEYLNGRISPSVNISDPREIFAQMPNIGPELSKRIADKFGNAFYAWNQFPEGWVRVDGIGQATVDGIEEWLRGES